jgi:hypothetical protein
MRSPSSLLGKGTGFIGALVVAGMVAQAAPVQANPLTLTNAGTTLGFTLSIFAITNPGYNSCCNGPFGLTVTQTGHVIASVNGTGTRYQWNDVDGQTLASALSSHASDSSTTAYANAGGVAYGSQGGRFVQFNGDGSVNHILTGVTATPYLGMWGNPVNGHIIATSSSGLIDIDPLANGGNGSFRVINASAFGDGVSVSPDGTIAYLANGNVVVYNIATGAVITTENAGCSGLDGTGTISSSNVLNGQIVANCNDGTVTLINPLTNTFQVIASGGFRGDYVAPDITNGTLLLDASDVIYRLSCGPNCVIGTGPTTLPEPTSMVLLGSGLVGLAAGLRRKNRG